MPSAFVESMCLPFLLGAQNGDGGWGFHSGSASRAEPTAWALMALAESGATQREGVERAAKFLSGAQLPDGSWASSPEQSEGSWVTALAGLALLGRESASESVARSVAWLCKELPGEARFWRKTVQRFWSNPSQTKQDDSLYGWSWTIGTASWVEPTAYAIFLLRGAPSAIVPASAQQRIRTAEAMLYDRMCPGGGWNCGNPMVYGVPGEPQVTSTAWALLALTAHPERPEVQQSLSWLEGNSRAIHSPGSAALAVLALNTYHRPCAALSESLRGLYEKQELEWNVAETAWAALALCETRNWLHPALLKSPEEKG